MRLRVVDYAYNAGGGARFAAEMLKALAARGPDLSVEVVSYGDALTAYRALVAASCPSISVRAIKPRNFRRVTPPTRVRGLRGTGRLRRLLGYGRDTFFDVPESVYLDCDIVWLPWGHRHRVPEQCAGRTVATIHDIIMVQSAEALKGAGLRDLILTEERESLRRWLASDARLVITSRATAHSMRDTFGAPEDRFDLIPILARHVPPPGSLRVSLQLPADWTWAERPFVICPANTSPQKNHEVLLAGVGAWGARLPLVLTGLGTDLPPSIARGARLREIAESAGLTIGSSLIPVGYLSDDVYYALLSRAWALVMPTLAEGGGSYPVLEAMLYGVPVVCSDIPVLREQIERTGGHVLWFDPHDPEDLARRLRELEEEYGRYKRMAEQQVAALRVQTWEDVAAGYESVMRSMLKQPQVQQRREETLA